jgi:hypothetical protein
MGENRVRGESILGKLVEKEACCLGDCHLSITQNTAYLNNLYFGYKKYKFGSIHFVTLMIKTMNGEKKCA